MLCIKNCTKIFTGNENASTKVVLLLNNELHKHVTSRDWIDYKLSPSVAVYSSCCIRVSQFLTGHRSQANASQIP